MDGRHEQACAGVCLSTQIWECGGGAWRGHLFLEGSGPGQPRWSLMGAGQE